MLDKSNKVNNQDILAVLEAMQRKSESVVVLNNEEVSNLREFLKTVSVDDLKYMKEYVEDKKAIFRVFRKVKRFSMAFAAIIVAYLTLYDSLKEFVVKFLTTGS